MAEFLTFDDLIPFATIDAAKAEAMIEDATAMAVLAAPCLGAEPTTLTQGQQDAVKALLRGAILRWNEAGTGALQAQQVGPFGQTLDTRQQRRGMFWPSEIEQLQNICKGEQNDGAFTVDTYSTGGLAVGHAESCALNFGALYCSCGYALTQELPLYGG